MARLPTPDDLAALVGKALHGAGAPAAIHVRDAPMPERDEMIDGDPRPHPIVVRDRVVRSDMALQENVGASDALLRSCAASPLN